MPAPIAPSEYFKDGRRQAAGLRAMANELREDSRRKTSLAARLEAIARAIELAVAPAVKDESARLPKPTTVNPRPKSVDPLGPDGAATEAHD